MDTDNTLSLSAEDGNIIVLRNVAVSVITAMVMWRIVIKICENSGNLFT